MVKVGKKINLGVNVTRYEVVNGNIDLKQAIESSDNIFFARVALELGSKKFEKGKN